ncbi:MAG TPA: DUF998 domain-containing protein [Cellulomonas sp.]
MTPSSARRLRSVPPDAVPSASRTADLPRDRARPPWWAVLTSVTAPVAMIGGWTLAGAVQGGFDPVRRTISDLAATTAVHPGIMTTGLLLTGAAHVGTALGLRAAAVPGRLLLALGGLGTAAVAVLPSDRVPSAHGVAAAVAFGSLALWPAAASRSRRGDRGAAPGPGSPARAPAVLGRAAGVAASVVLTGLLVWFVLELQGAAPDQGATTGLAERAVAGAQSLWPCVVVLALRRGR